MERRLYLYWEELIKLEHAAGGEKKPPPPLGGGGVPEKLSIAGRGPPHPLMEHYCNSGKILLKTNNAKHLPVFNIGIPIDGMCT